MNRMNPITLGRYRHYKGEEYSVVGFARHSETEATMVLYVPLYGDGGYWVRPLDMFVEQLTVDGKTVSRFEFAGD
jgi:cyclomaltodextrinase